MGKPTVKIKTNRVKSIVLSKKIFIKKVAYFFVPITIFGQFDFNLLWRVEEKHEFVQNKIFSRSYQCVFKCIKIYKILDIIFDNVCQSKNKIYHLLLIVIENYRNLNYPGPYSTIKYWPLHFVVVKMCKISHSWFSDKINVWPWTSWFASQII